MRAHQLAALAAAACLASAVPAAGGTPGSEKIAGAVAEANRKAGRSKALLIEVSLETADGAPGATGTLVTQPTGLARLELHGAAGVERHLLQGSQYAASLNGELLASPRPLLPPLFLLQADSGASLRAALASFGVSASETGLGLADDRDCYVIGGRSAPVPGGVAASVPALWVEVATYEPALVDRADGVRYRFGPQGTFDGVRMPRWVEISAPGQPALRLEILRVARANAPAAAFGTSWLSGTP